MSSPPHDRSWIRRTALVAAVLALVCGHRARANAGAAEVERQRVRLAEIERVAGPDATAAAEVIGALVDALRRGDKRAAAEARPLAERAVAILEKSHGAEALELLPALRRLGQVLMEAGEYRAARPVLERAVALRAAHPDPSGAAELAELETTLATLCRVQGDFARARDLLERALATQAAALGPDHEDVARTLTVLGNVLTATGDYGGARTRYDRALAIWERVEGRTGPRAATTLHNLGKLLRATGDYAQARTFLEEALRSRESASGASSREVADTADVLANVLSELGELADARTLFERALAIYEGKLGRDHVDVARCLNDLGSLHFRSGDSLRAREMYERALAIRERALSADHPDVAQTANNLGLVFLDAEEWDKADALLARAQTAREQKLGAGHPTVGRVVRNRALLARRRGERVAAEALYRKALAIYEASDLADHPEVASLRFELAGLLRELKRPVEAREMVGAALALQERVLGPDHPWTLRSRKRLADLEWDANEDAQALRDAARSAEGVTLHLRDTLAVLPEREALRFVADQTRPEEVLFSGLLAAGADAPAWRSACWDFTLHRRGLVLEQLASRTRVALHEPTPKVRAAWDHLVAARLRLAALWIRGGGGGTVARDRAELEAASREKERAEAELARVSRSFRSESKSARAGLREIAAALPPRSVLVEIVHAWIRSRGATEGTWHEVALVLRKDGTHDHVDLGPSDRVRRLVSEWREALDNGFRAIEAGVGAEAQAEMRLAGVALRRAVWDPVLSRASAARDVFLVPDGDLHRVDLGALPESAGGYVVESGVEIHLLGSGLDLLRPARPPPDRRRGKGVLVVGAPDFDAVPVGAGAGPSGDASGVTASLRCARGGEAGWTPLRGAWHEARSVAAVFEAKEPTLLLSAADATEERFRREVGGKRILHVATHAFFLEGPCDPADPSRSGAGRARAKQHAGEESLPSVVADNPLLLSGLVLAGANHASERTGGDDGIVTAEELAALDLSGVELAVLSGCDTGLGRVTIGEGVYGLRRALETAGAQAVVMSLWRVPDAQAKKWVAAFYGERDKGAAPDDAARAAERTLLEELRVEGRTEHPYLWAGMVCAGGWR